MLYVIFFLSGCAALIFETLWFRVAGLGLGNSVWASSIVLGSFMTGVGIGSFLTARFSSKLRRPLLIYAALEVIIAIVSVTAVLAFPALIRVLTPLFQQNAEQPGTLNLIRWGVSFAMFILPSTAMGATLPVLVSMFSMDESRFGVTLGRLYGVNTLGAMFGAVIAEVLLVPAIGVRGSALAAGLIDLFCVAVAVMIARKMPEIIPPERVETRERSGKGRRFVLAAGLCGGILLALEVIWMRLLQLYVTATSLAFALMLAVVLFGIGAGGLIASRLGKLEPRRVISPLALLSALSVVLGYLFLSHIKQPAHTSISHSDLTLLYSCILSLAPSLLSGMLFTFIGRQIRRYSGNSSEATGILALANTIGAAAGSIGAGFLLIPYLGVEASIFLMALLYLVTSFVVWDPAPGETARGSLLNPVHGSLLIAATCALLFFPFGAMHGRILPDAVKTYLSTDSTIEAVREGQSETAIMIRNDLMGIPYRHRLATNRISMSATTLRCRRYMRMYAYLPFALKPDAANALLICFGVGNTAQALTDSPSLKSIDVVDISKNILQLSRDSSLFAGQPHPLDDPRVRVNIEDGRFYLQATKRQYDIITGEPPPPGMAGVVNLYSREFFQLVHDRLADGGITTYWLPLYLMTAKEARAVTRAFADVFPDATLWTGAGSDWMLMGTKNWKGKVEAEKVARLLEDPRIGPRLRDIGIETPADFGATFLADSAQLQTWLRGIDPVVDDFPHRLAGRVRAADTPSSLNPLYLQRFLESAWIAEHWPAELKAQTAERFPVQWAVDEYLEDQGDWRLGLATLLGLPKTTAGQLIVLGVNSNLIDYYKDKEPDPRYEGLLNLDYSRAAKLFAEGDYRAAYEQFSALFQKYPDEVRLEQLSIMSAILAGASDAIHPRMEKYFQKYPEDTVFREVLDKLSTQKLSKQ